MCSIYGALYGKPEILDHLSDRGRDRGRDQHVRFVVDDRVTLGLCRAIPTTELENWRPKSNKVVFNGIISNDVKLGRTDNEIDTDVLGRVVNIDNLWNFRSSIQKIDGGFALAAWRMDDIYLACNFKPIYYAKIDGGLYFSSMYRHFEYLLDYGVAPVKMLPYSTMSLKTGFRLSLRTAYNSSVAVICSGGLDSTVAAAKLIRDGYDVTLLHYTYGCRAQNQEVDRVKRIARRFGCDYEVLSLIVHDDTSPLLNTESVIAPGVAGAEKAHEWVNARNLLMVSHTVAYCESKNINRLATGINLEEGGAYPDNEEEFYTLLNAALPYAVKTDFPLKIESPVGQMMKHEIVKLGLELNAPLDLTYSCYHGNDTHCRQCGPCFMRTTAFERNNAIDTAL